MLNFLGLPSQASTHAADIDQMIVLVHWLMLVLFVGWGAFFLFVLFRFRSSANPKADYAGAKGKLSKGLEVADRGRRNGPAGLLRDPGLGEARQGVPGRERSDRRPRRRRAVRLERPLSRARRQVRPDRRQAGVAPTIRSASIAPIRTRKDDITTINQLNLPVDRPVLVHLSSKDVIHSFGLYEMRVKQDAIPGPRHPGLVHPEPRRRVRDHLLAAVRPRPLPDARVRQRPEPGRLPEVVRRRRRKNFSRRLRLRRQRRKKVPSTKFEVRRVTLPRTSDFVLRTFRASAPVPRLAPPLFGRRDPQR